MLNTLLLGDSISLHYRPYLFQIPSNAVSFAPNRAELAQLYPPTCARTLRQAAKFCLNLVGRGGRSLDTPRDLNCGNSANLLKKLETCRAYNMFDADLILLNCGLRDLKLDKSTNTHNVELEDYRNNLQQIINLTAQWHLIWLTTTPVIDGRHQRKGFDRREADHAAYNAAAKEIMSATGVYILDLCAFTQNLSRQQNGAIYCDHVHFDVATRKKQAAFIAAGLDEYAQQKGLANG
ncbi:MAG: SGNH/GDSL hydrolase family protein [Lachnospiraceae bacterium]|jgi:hypothetical protein|nr:SGNH/GDSL hydrolase family protein [Lachnospiraceae bacterium]